jgi:DNA-binding PadR family transcriptional regulator
MFSKNLRSASLEPLILSLLADGARYGYQIIRQARRISDGEIRWSNSKLYPLLHRMEYDGLLETFWRPSEDGPDRKYYRLTARGQEALARSKREWKSMNLILEELWAAQPAIG